MILKNKRGFEMSFAWLFAIIVGAVILFLAIYGTMQFIGVAKYQQYTEAAASISILLDPLETGIASAIGNVIGFNKETRTYWNCEDPTIDNAFGRQTISFSEKSGIGQEWAPPGGEISVRNKFIFVDRIEEGDNLYLFSKPFYMGFKVSDVIMASSDDYCFVAPPNVIRTEIEQLGLKNINITNSITECLEQSSSVCFGAVSESCEIVVYNNDEEYSSGQVTKDGQSMTYVGSLLYGAIFSDPRIYECNVGRLGVKISELAQVYDGKISIVRLDGCDSIISPYLGTLASGALNIQSSSELISLYQIAQTMDRENEDAECGIYPGEDY